MAGSSVLIVDDNVMNRKLVEVLLASEGFEVRAAADADEARRILGEWVPSCILMDVQLPGMDGLELTRQLRQDDRLAAVPIVALTAYAMKGDEERAIAAGCDAYVTKPIDTRNLGRKLQEIIAARGS